MSKFGSEEYLIEELKRRPSVKRVFVKKTGVACISLLVQLDSTHYDDISHLLKYINDLKPVQIMIKDIKITYNSLDYFVSKLFMEVESSL